MYLNKRFSLDLSSLYGGVIVTIDRFGLQMRRREDFYLCSRGPPNNATLIPSAIISSYSHISSSSHPSPILNLTPCTPQIILTPQSIHIHYNILTPHPHSSTAILIDLYRPYFISVSRRPLLIPFRILLTHSSSSYPLLTLYPLPTPYPLLTPYTLPTPHPLLTPHTHSSPPYPLLTS